jgi:hypothetical protein
MSVDVTTVISNLWPLLHATSNADVVSTSDAELTRLISDELRKVSRTYGCFIARDTTSIIFVSGTPIYNAPPDHLSTLHIAYNGKPLTPTTTFELEALDPNYLTTAANGSKGPVQNWYSDKNGPNLIGFYPVPAAADVGLSPEVIYHIMPCGIDEAHTQTIINAPAFFGDYLEIKAMADSYRKESDLQMPEVAKTLDQLAALYEEIMKSLWGMSQ